MSSNTIKSCFCAAFFLFAANSVWGQACDPSLLFKSDPVELVRGKEVAGQEGIFADHFRYRYQFASEENKAEFLKNPAEYEIQLGGSCGRMGPLSGPGSTGIHAVHEGRIYIFASEQCRKTFLSGPEKFLESDDPVPQATPESTRKGRELLEKAVEAMGGASRIDGIRRFVSRREKDEKHQDKVVATSETLTLEFPDKVRHENTWGESGYSFRAADGKGWYQGSKEGYPLHAQQNASLYRQTFGRNLIALLKARNEPQTAVAHVGSGEVERDGKKISIEKVAVAFRGCTTTLNINPATGEIISMSYRAAGPRLSLKTIERVFSNYGSTGGVILPMSASVTFDGKPVDDSPVHLKFVRLDEPVEPSFFEAPKP